MAARKQQELDQSKIKEPEEWTTGDEPMTGAQESYLHTLAREAGEDVAEDDLTKAEASQKIDELREKTGRDASPPTPKRRPKKAGKSRR